MNPSGFVAACAGSHWRHCTMAMCRASQSLRLAAENGDEQARHKYQAILATCGDGSGRDALDSGAMHAALQACMPGVPGEVRCTGVPFGASLAPLALCPLAKCDCISNGNWHLWSLRMRCADRRRWVTVTVQLLACPRSDALAGDASGVGQGRHELIRFPGPCRPQLGRTGAQGAGLCRVSSRLPGEEPCAPCGLHYAALSKCSPAAWNTFSCSQANHECTPNVARVDNPDATGLAMPLVRVRVRIHTCAMHEVMT